MARTGASTEYLATECHATVDSHGNNTSSVAFPIKPELSRRKGVVKRKVRNTPPVILAAGVEEGQVSRQEMVLDKFQV